MQDVQDLYTENYVMLPKFKVKLNIWINISYLFIRKRYSKDMNFSQIYHIFNTVSINIPKCLCKCVYINKTCGTLPIHGKDQNKKKEKMKY